MAAPISECPGDTLLERAEKSLKAALEWERMSDQMVGQALMRDLLRIAGEGAHV